MVWGREIDQLGAQALVQKIKGDQLRAEKAGLGLTRGQAKTAKWEYAIVETKQQDASWDWKEEKKERKSRKESVENSHLSATWKRHYCHGGEASLRNKRKTCLNRGSESHP